MNPGKWQVSGWPEVTYEAALHVIVDYGGRGAVLQEEHQGTVVEVVPLVGQVRYFLVRLDTLSSLLGRVEASPGPGRFRPGGRTLRYA